MISTDSDTRSITPQVFARSWFALRGCLEYGFPSVLAHIAPVRGAAVSYPRLSVCTDQAEFQIGNIRSADGRLHLFADGREVLLPGRNRDHAQEIVSVLVSILDAYGRAN